MADLLTFTKALALGLRPDRPLGPQLAALGMATKPAPIAKAAHTSTEAEGPITKAARQAAFRPCLACPNGAACASHDTCAAEVSGIAKARTMQGAAFLATGAEARRRIAADPRLAARRPLPRHWAPPSVPKD